MRRCFSRNFFCNSSAASAAGMIRGHRQAPPAGVSAHVAALARADVTRRGWRSSCSVWSQVLLRGPSVAAAECCAPRS